MNFSLPLVSIVVVNHNYGRFLSEVIESILSQTYPYIECILVDNASTDNSEQVIQEIRSAHPEIIFIQRCSNDGQSAASIDGFRSSSGQYVVFVDADDWLLPEFVRTHVFVHLSARIHVGLTSSDMFQAYGDRIILGTGQAMNNYFRSGQGPTPRIARSVAGALKSIQHFDGIDDAVLDQLYFVSPGPVQWVWSSTSGNFYRRDALRLIMGARKLPALRAATDVFCCAGVNGLCGALLIDLPLSIYRIHGTNFCTKQPQLYGQQVLRAANDLTLDALETLIDHLVDQRQMILTGMQDESYYLDLLASITQSRDRRRSVSGGSLEQHTEKPLPAPSKLARLAERASALLLKQPRIRAGT